jgi:hypothetical protein
MDSVIKYLQKQNLVVNLGAWCRSVRKARVKVCPFLGGNGLPIQKNINCYSICHRIVPKLREMYWGDHCPCDICSQNSLVEYARLILKHINDKREVTCGKLIEAGGTVIEGISERNWDVCD